MSVSDGQLANENTFNTSFMSREVDTSTIGKVDLANTDGVSGASVANLQRILNSIASATGMTTSEVYNFLFTYSSNVVGAANDTVLARLNALTLKFRGTTGLSHAHTGADGQGEKVSATMLLDINQFRATTQKIAVTGAAGTSDDVSSLLGGKSSGGTSTQAGVVTTGAFNKVGIINTLTEDRVQDTEGQIVYGRLTESAGVWTLSYYTNEAGVETAYNFASPTDITVFFLEVFTLATFPTFGESFAEFGSLDVGADVPEATASIPGKVSTGTQTFGGAKTFADTTESTDKDTGSIITEGGIGVEKRINAGGAIATADTTQASSTTTGALKSAGGIAAVKQIISGEDLIAVLSLIINFGGNDASADGKGVTVKRTTTDGKMLFDSTLPSKWKAGLAGSESEIETVGTDQTITGKKNFTGEVAFGSQSLDVTGDASIVGTDLNPNSPIVRIIGSNISTFHGATAPSPANGQLLTLHNASSFTMTIAHESGTEPTPANRFSLPSATDITIVAGSSAEFFYDTTSSRWKQKSGSGSGSGGGAYQSNSDLTLTASDTLAITTSGLQSWLVQGNAAGLTTMSTTPFGTTPPTDRTVIEVIGNSSANPVEFVENDAANGCVGFGSSFVLNQYSTIAFMYVSALARYVCISKT